jgi:prephenate dehydratase
MNKSKIIYGIQGGEGSFNHQALLDYTSRHAIVDYDIMYLYTTDGVLKALNNNDIDYGQFAIHNSTGGIVIETIEAMGRYNFAIVEEFAILIKHFMHIKPNIEMSQIDTIMTHPQVLKQCKKNLNQKYSYLHMKSGEGDLIDHAAVASALGQDELSDNIAVMGPESLGKLYGLKTVDGNLQDNDENWTSFLMTKTL